MQQTACAVLGALEKAWEEGGWGGVMVHIVDAACAGYFVSESGGMLFGLSVSDVHMLLEVQAGLQMHESKMTDALRS